MNVFGKLLNVYERRYVISALLTLAWVLFYPVWRIVSFYPYVYAHIEAMALDEGCHAEWEACPVPFGLYILVGASLYFFLVLSIYAQMKKAQWGAWLVQGVFLSLVNLAALWMIYLYFLISFLPVDALGTDPSAILSRLIPWICPLLM